MTSNIDLRYSFKPGEPQELHECQVVTGVLGEIAPYLPGFVLAAIGKRKIILLAEFRKKIAKHAGYRIEVLRLDGKYTVVMLEARTCAP